MDTIRAVYDDGVLRPLERLNLPDQATVEFEPRVIEIPPSTGDDDPAWSAAINRAWGEEWDDPREDIYTLEDGEPIDAAG